MKSSSSGRSGMAAGEKVRLATKLPSWLIKPDGDFERYLNEQLERLQTSKIDFYLLHGLNRGHWPRLREPGVLRWAEGAMTAGRIGHLGFSFHDDYEVFKGIIDDYDNWAFCQIQYNYMDADFQAGNRGLKYAANKGLAVVVMEPIRGGQLSKEPPEKVASATRSGPGTLTADEPALIDKVRAAYHGFSPIPCTKCGYCLPCPNGVEIPRIFELYNDAIMYDDARTARGLYRGPSGLREEQRADRCLNCGECVEACPQNIPIPEWLEKAAGLLGPPKK